ncbi:VOC family protein [Arthrobacter silvisoli]|uniref:VOC family protein n=1 Tax=Arthrobacter silvisoli TaxID=2291022 RepID=UPI000E2163E0|nr:VOC family protein [Arthrobacter silvisoli]
MGGVVHFEIPADDEERARNFYGAAFGWRFQVLPGMEYSLADTSEPGNAGEGAGGHSINGGIFRRGEMLKAPVVTIDVEDIDRALEQISLLGGETVRAKMEVPGTGWNAYFRDSEGNVIGLWQDRA